MLRRLTTVPFSFNFIFSLSADYWPSCSKSTSLGRHALGNAKSDHKWPRTIFLCQRPEPSIILLCPSWAIFCGLSFPVRWHSPCLFLRLGTSVVDDVIQLKLREGRWDRDLWPDTDTVGEMINAFPELGLVTNRYRRLVRQRASEQDRKKEKEKQYPQCVCVCVFACVCVYVLERSLKLFIQFDYSVHPCSHLVIPHLLCHVPPVVEWKRYVGLWPVGRDICLVNDAVSTWAVDEI